mgnify:CR=1 FL=1
MTKDFKIIDSHAHLKGQVVAKRKEASDPIENIIEKMNHLGIEKTCLQGLSSGDNELMPRAVGKYPSRLVPFAYIDPQSSSGTEGLDKIYGIGEIYIRPGSSETPDDYLEGVLSIARKENYPVLFHTGEFSYTAPMIFREVINNNEDITFILGHMGALIYVKDAIHLAKEYENVYLETSGMTSKEILERAVRVCGSDKLIFGSDYPFWNPESQIELIKSLDLDVKSKRNIFSGNIEKLIF